jgi:chemotaxis protein methyltransferase CheR
MVSFKQVNLMKDLSALGDFDVIFCRNVLIYFDVATKGLVLDKLSKRLNRDGFLFLGGAETLLGLSTSLSSVNGLRGIYAHGSAVSTSQRVAA